RPLIRAPNSRLRSPAKTMCEWLSTKPGMAHRPAASTRASAAGAWAAGPAQATRPSSITSAASAISPVGPSPSAGSLVASTPIRSISTVRGSLWFIGLFLPFPVGSFRAPHGPGRGPGAPGTYCFGLLWLFGLLWPASRPGRPEIRAARPTAVSRGPGAPRPPNGGNARGAAGTGRGRRCPRRGPARPGRPAGERAVRPAVTAASVPDRCGRLPDRPCTGAGGPWSFRPSPLTAHRAPSAGPSAGADRRRAVPPAAARLPPGTARPAGRDRFRRRACPPRRSGPRRSSRPPSPFRLLPGAPAAATRPAPESACEGALAGPLAGGRAVPAAREPVPRPGPEAGPRGRAGAIAPAAPPGADAVRRPPHGSGAGRRPASPGLLGGAGSPEELPDRGVQAGRGVRHRGVHSVPDDPPAVGHDVPHLGAGRREDRGLGGLGRVEPGRPDPVQVEDHQVGAFALADPAGVVIPAEGVGVAVLVQRVQEQERGEGPPAAGAQPLVHLRRARLGQRVDGGVAVA